MEHRFKTALKIIIVSVVCLGSVACTLEPPRDNSVPVAGHITLSGLDAYNGNYVILFGHMSWRNDFMRLLGSAEPSGEGYDNCYVITALKLKGIRIINGKATLPFYAIEGLDELIRKTVMGAFRPLNRFASVRVYINTREEMAFRNGFETEHTIATGILPAGLQESASITFDKAECTGWVDLK